MNHTKIASQTQVDVRIFDKIDDFSTASIYRRCFTAVAYAKGTATVCAL